MASMQVTLDSVRAIADGAMIQSLHSSPGEAYYFGTDLTANNRGTRLQLNGPVALVDMPEIVTKYAICYSIRDASILPCVIRTVGEYSLGTAKATVTIVEGREPRPVVDVQGPHWPDCKELYRKIVLGDIAADASYNGEQVQPFTIQGFTETLRRWWSQRKLRKVEV